MCTHIGNSNLSIACIYPGNLDNQLDRINFTLLTVVKYTKQCGVMLGEVGWGKQLKEPVADFP